MEIVTTAAPTAPVKAPASVYVLDLVHYKKSQPVAQVGQPIPRLDGPMPLASSVPAAQKMSIDLDTVPQINGQDLYDLDLEGFEDKPWRKPGADITDYFNYGFNEITWKMYCGKQKAIRDELAMQKRRNVRITF